MDVILLLLGVLAALAALVWIGLQVKPAPLPAYSQPQPELETVPLPTAPAGLPAPVERYYRQRCGERVPLVRSAVISGRGALRMKGLKLPIRFRFTHLAGQDYRHYIEVNFFGLPVMKINEYYVNGKERMVFPWGVDDNNPRLDQGGALGMWAESIEWLPSILVTDPRVRWEPVDADSAFLLVPFGLGMERFLVRFDPATGGIKYWEVMRYQNGKGDKILWINGAWFDDGRPWAIFKAEETLFNVDVSVTAQGLP